MQAELTVNKTVLLAKAVAFREAAEMAMDKAACQPSAAAFNALMDFVKELNAKASLCEMEAGQ